MYHLGYMKANGNEWFYINELIPAFPELKGGNSFFSFFKQSSLLIVIIIITIIFININMIWNTLVDKNEYMKTALDIRQGWNICLNSLDM